MIYSSLCFILQNKWLEKKKKCYFFIYKEVKVSPQSKLLKKKKKKLET